MAKFEKLEEMAIKFDELSAEEKDFVTYLSLQHIINQYENEINKNTNNIMYSMYLKDAMKSLEATKDALGYKIF